MPPRLSSRQQVQLAFVQSLSPRLEQVKKCIDLMEAMQADDTVVRGMCKTLDALKSHASQLNLSNLADTSGLMSALARRGGGLQMKVRGLRELYSKFRSECDGALRAAMTPEDRPLDGGDPAGQK